MNVFPVTPLEKALGISALGVLLGNLLRWPQSRYLR
jgi:hypothetical protein